MPVPDRRRAGWIALLVAIALGGSAAVVYALVSVTSPTAPAEPQAVTQQVPTSSSGPLPPHSPGTTFTGAASSGVASSGSSPLTTNPSAAAGTTTTADHAVILAGSKIVLPATWSGSAEFTITVNGACAEGATSNYTTTADLALDNPIPVPATSTSPVTSSPATTSAVTTSAVTTSAVTTSAVTSTLPTSTLPTSTVTTSAETTTALTTTAMTTGSRPTGSQVPPSAAGSPAEPGTSGAATSAPDPAPFLLSLGVNATGVPSFSLFSAAADEGNVHQYWELTAKGAAGGRTAIAGTFTGADEPGAADLNLLADAETESLGCSPPDSVPLPRPLGAESTLSGWVGQDQANLVINAVTADGERTVRIDLALDRRR